MSDAANNNGAVSAAASYIFGTSSRQIKFTEFSFVERRALNSRTSEKWFLKLKLVSLRKKYWLSPPKLLKSYYFPSFLDLCEATAMSSTKIKRRQSSENANRTIKRRPYTRSQGLKITALNDDCLREMFSYLSAKDLSAMKVSCGRFICMAEEMFEKKFINTKGKFKVRAEDDHGGNAAIIEEFGHLMPNVDLSLRTVNCNNQKKYFTQLKHCNALDGLSISGVNFDGIPIECIDVDTFKNLNKLNLVGCSGTGTAFKRILNCCDSSSLKTLHVYGDEAVVSDQMLAHIAKRFPNLNDLFIYLTATTSSSAANVLKLQNMKYLKSFAMETPSNFPIAALIDALAGNKLLQQLFLITGSILDENVANAINRLSTNVRCCALWLTEKVPDTLLSKITNFKCIKYVFRAECADGNIFYGHQFERWLIMPASSWTLGRFTQNLLRLKYSVEIAKQEYAVVPLIFKNLELKSIINEINVNIGAFRAFITIVRFSSAKLTGHEQSKSKYSHSRNADFIFTIHAKEAGHKIRPNYCATCQKANNNFASPCTPQRLQFHRRSQWHSAWYIGCRSECVNVSHRNGLAIALCFVLLNVRDSNIFMSTTNEFIFSKSFKSLINGMSN